MDGIALLSSGGRFLGQPKTTEIYAGHIEMGTKKQMDYLADFWKGKLVDSDIVATIPATIKGGK